MNDRESCTCTLDPPAKIPPESTGLSAPDEQAVPGLERRQRPLSLAWISDELLANTIDVWSTNYGRPVSEDEAVEILMNVKRFTEVLMDARKDMD